jgi:hypothetical protein
MVGVQFSLSLIAELVLMVACRPSKSMVRVQVSYSAHSDVSQLVDGNPVKIEVTGAGPVIGA